MRGWGGERPHFEVPFKKGAEDIDKMRDFFPERLRETLTFEEDVDSWVVKPAEETKPEDINELAEVAERMGGICLFIGGKSCFRIPKTAVTEKQPKTTSKREEEPPHHRRGWTSETKRG